MKHFALFLILFICLNNTLRSELITEPVKSATQWLIRLPTVSTVNEYDLSPFFRELPSKVPRYYYVGRNEGSVIFVSNLGNSVVRSAGISMYLSKDVVLDSLDTFLFTRIITSINPGTYYDLLFSFQVPNVEPGIYYLIAQADSGNLIQETNEQNNLTASSIQIVPAINDFSITSLNLSSIYLSSDDEIILQTGVANSVSTNAAVASIGYYLSRDTQLDTADVLLKEDTINLLYSNYSLHSALIKIPEVINGGIYYLIAFADHKNVVREWYESNNLRTIKVSINYQYVDFVIPSIQLDTTFPYRGRLEAISHTFTNIGNMAGIGIPGRYIGYFLSKDTIYDYEDRFLDSKLIDTRASKDSVEINTLLLIPSNIPSGDYYIIVVADYGNTWSEFNEDNNTNSVKLKIFNPVLNTEGTIYRHSVNTLFPNPTTGVLNIQASETIDQVEVSNIYSHIVDTYNISSLADKIDITYLPPGLYTIKLKRSEGVISTSKVLLFK